MHKELPHCSLLVLSCDAYRDLWPPFFALLRHRWPDCRYPCYLGAGSLHSGEKDVITLNSSAGRDWSGCLLDYLDQIPTPYVLLMLDDFFLRRRVDGKLIDDCLLFAERCKARQVRLIPRPGPTRKIAGSNLIGECEAGVRYRVCAQASIWDKRQLGDLLARGESAWEFEHNATFRAESQPAGHYCARRAVLPYEGLFAHHVVEKGCWLPHEKWIFGRQRIGCDFRVRKTLPWGQTLACFLAKIFIGTTNAVPLPISNTIRALVRRGMMLIMPQVLRRLSGRQS
jgi:hypothetical protein